MAANPISWNTAYVKRLTKAEFVAKFKGVHKGADLSAEYDRIAGKPRKKKGK